MADLEKYVHPDGDDQMEIGLEDLEDLSAEEDFGMGDDMGFDTEVAPDAAATDVAPAPEAGGLPPLQEEVDVDLNMLYEELNTASIPKETDTGWAGSADPDAEDRLKARDAGANGDACKKCSGEDDDAPCTCPKEDSKEIQKENIILGKAALKFRKENKKLKSVLKTLQEKLEQVNVSNAKLLYINQTLENPSLNERQKQKVVEAISKTDSVQEAKTIFETLKHAVGTTTKQTVPDSLNEVASRKSSLLIAARQQTKEDAGNPFFDRMRKLAGIT